MVETQSLAGFDGAEFNSYESFVPFTLEASTTWSVSAPIASTTHSTTWQVFTTVRQTRGTTWSVAYGCRGMKNFQALDRPRVLTSSYRDKTSALVAFVTYCQLSPKTKSLVTTDHTGKYAIIAQTKDLYLDEIGGIYYKNVESGYLGAAGVINADNYPNYSDQIIRLQNAFSE